MVLSSHHVAVLFACVCVQTQSVVGLLEDEADPLVSVMKVEKAPTEVC